ncbi:MAG: response regulator [Verrucomicrobia bacterium]|nr:response regulator [Verrucomicrobiota bacterium]
MSSKARHILVVDDEPGICAAIKMMFQHDGHRVEVAHNAKDALALLELHPFSLVTTDYNMHGMKGDELAAVIKQSRPHLPVIMITAHAYALKSSGQPLPGVDCLVSKPFLLADLRAAVAQFPPRPPAG